jgi:hypothetical protein
VQVVAPPACVYPVDLTAGVFIEAEGSSRHAGPFLRVDEKGRGNDSFIQVDPAAASVTDVPDEGNVMWYDIDVAKAGDGYLWLLGNGPAPTSDTVFVSLNGGPDQIVTLTPAAWGWTRAATALKFPAGKQTLKIKAGKAGAQLDRIWLTSDGAATAPDGLGAATPDTVCSKGQVFEPPSGGSGGTGGSSASGGAGVTTGGSAGQVGTGGGVNAGAGPSAGVGPGSGSDSGASSSGQPSGTTPAAADGCGCRIVSSANSSGQLLGLLGLLSTAWVAAGRRSRRFRGVRSR